MKKKQTLKEWVDSIKDKIRTTATSRVSDKRGYEYVGLSNGQIVHPETARRNKKLK